VRDAIKRRGECWRISPLPKSPAEMKQMIAASRIGIGGAEIYYYSKPAGTRFLTCQEFAQLARQDDAGLRQYLIEIKDFSARGNRMGHPEIDFFTAERRFTWRDLAAYDLGALGADQLRAAHEALARRFHDSVGPEFRQDDVENLEWRTRMFAALIGHSDAAVWEEAMLGLSSEFFMQIEWLPGGRIEEGELIFDPVFEERAGAGETPAESRRDEKPRGFIFNFIREFGDLEYVNIGRVIGSLSRRQPSSGRRDVYIAEIKPRESPREIVRIIRMQKWGVREHLDDGKALLSAMVESQEYTEYVLDRRLGCRQLGMNLPTRITAGRIAERYFGSRPDCEGIQIWSQYFERDYIHGIATDKMPNSRFADEAFAIRFARLLGGAAAPNIVVGRLDLKGRVIFDDGDEVVIEDDCGMPVEIVVSDHTGTFSDYRTDLRRFAPDYARPVNSRAAFVCDPQAFARAYMEAFIERVSEIRRDYRKRKRAFDTLFKHRPRDEAGSFAFRWEQVLERLDRTDPRELGEEVRRNVVLR
jgi:hypothetical protein